MPEKAADFNPEAFVRNAYAVAERKDLEGWKSMFNPDGIFVDESVKITYKDGNWDYPVRNYGTAFADRCSNCAVCGEQGGFVVF